MVARDKEDLSGQQIGNYEIVSHIAARKASDLFLARDVKLERLVFLEVLRVTSGEDRDLADRFRRRMETVSHLKDPHIAVVSDLDVTDDGFPYAVIDYFPGETLAEKLEDLRRDDQTLPVIESLELTKQIAQGLGLAHAAGLVHHDLRPENIMLREDGTPVLIDLGVPFVVGPKAPGVNGPDNEMLDYAATEELEGKPITRRSNIYSLGVILYELLAGHRPYLPNLPFDIFPQANMPKEEPLDEARPGLAGETYRLVRNCLWRQEWSRFETAEEMIAAIETAIFAEQELPKASVWTPRRSRSMAYMIPIALVLVGILAFFLLRNVFGSGGAEPTPGGTPEGTFVAGAETPGPVASATAPTTPEIPTDAASLSSIAWLQPAPNREFGPEDTINFDWFWPTVAPPGEHFAVYLIDGDQEYQLGTLLEPNNGSTYRLQIPVGELPVVGEDLAWQVRLESISGGDVRATSEHVPIAILSPEPTATATGTPPPTDTASPTPEACVPDPPFGWVTYSVRQGDSASAIAERGNITVEFLLQVNCLSDDLLSIGQLLYVPLSAVPRTPTPTPPPPTPIPLPSPTIQGITPAPPPPPSTSAPPTVTTQPTAGPPPTTPTSTLTPIEPTNPPPELTLTPGP
jgi:serine/threonine protein kinase